MARSRLDKTLADYVVIAISPALIMTLVGSLVFFLLDVSYRGQFESRIHWIMFWYVFAAVLVARIAIIEGREHAQLFGFVMCALAAIAIFRFVDAVIVGWLLLAVVWWCSSKLTWDCTLIDESVDSTGEGLLQTAGFGNPTAAEATNSEVPDRPLNTVSRADRKKKRAKRTSDIPETDPHQPERVDAVNANDEIRNSRIHAPGLWVVYFSLAALPLFGVGQLFIPAEETGRRSYEFLLLAVYVASGIMLLLTTSFLSLRRYLRQRNLEMPASVTRGWLGMGTALLVALLLLALIVPRPQGEYTLTGIIDKIDAKARQASQFAVLKGDRADGPGTRKGEPDPTAKQSGDGQTPKPNGKGEPDGNGQRNAQQGQQNDDGGGKSDNQSKSKQSGDDQNGREQSQRRDPSSQKPIKNESRGKEADKSRQGEKGDAPQSDNQRQNDQGQTRDQGRNADTKSKTSDSKANQTPPPNSARPNATNVMQTLAPFVKWMLYGMLAIVGIFFLIRHWSRLIQFLAKLWTEFLSLFFRRRKQKDAATEEPESAVRAHRPFASYENPFYSGTADRMTPSQLIRYTFEALEAWSREQAIERRPELTPLEFAQELGERAPALAKDAALTAQLYAHVAYARKAPSRDRLEVLERLWRRLGA